MKNINENDLQTARNAVRWFKALQVTKQKKGVKRLGGPKSGFCCLGFGCFLFNIPYVQAKAYSNEFARLVGLYSNNGEFKKSEIKYINIDIGGKKYYSLEYLNDVSSLSLNEIGVVIEENYKVVFKEHLHKYIYLILKKELK